MPTTITYEMELKKAEIHTDQLFNFGGAPGAIRTRDLWLRKPTLYPAELRAHVTSLIIAKPSVSWPFTFDPEQV